MKDNYELDIYVDKINSENRHPGYIYDFFLLIRGISNNRVITDLCDLLAHPRDRSRGYLVDDTLANYISLILQLVDPGNLNQPANLDRKDLLAALEKNIVYADKATYERIGIRKTKIKEIIAVMRNDILRGSITYIDPNTLSQLMTFSSITVVRPLFDNSTLFDQISKIRNTLSKSHKKFNHDAKIYISLFILSKMHKTRLRLKSGRNAELLVRSYKGFLSCLIHIFDVGPKHITVVYEIFKTNIPSKVHCAPIALDDERWDDVLMEATANLRLIQLI